MNITKVPPMRCLLLAALLAASPVVADQPVVTGADLIARCAMPDPGNQTLCNVYLSDVLRHLDWPEQAYGVALEGLNGMRWEGCPGEKGEHGIAHWHAYLPPLVVQYWQRNPSYPARLARQPWRSAMITTLTEEFPRCANSGAS